MRDLFGHDKVEDAIERLKMFEPAEGYYLADSGGKDSSVLLALAKMSGVKFDPHYSVTTIDPPELIYFLREFHPDTKWDRPEKPFLKRLVEKGFPMFDKRWCCEEYKEKGGDGRLVATGIRWAESKKREKRAMTESCYRNSSRHFIHPIIDWTDDDVWQFIYEYEIPVCELYRLGWNRIGCVMCPNNYRRGWESKRWPGIRRNFIQAFEALYNRRKGQGKESVNRWVNGKEMFEWWIALKPEGKNPDQTVLFE